MKAIGCGGISGSEDATSSAGLDPNPAYNTSAPRDISTPEGEHITKYSPSRPAARCGGGGGGGVCPPQPHYKHDPGATIQSSDITAAAVFASTGEW